MIHHGLSAREALVAATATAAHALGLGDQVGTIEPGRLADLVVVDGDPLERIGRPARPPTDLARPATRRARRRGGAGARPGE